MNRTLVALWAIIIGAIVSLAALVLVYNHQRQTDARLGLEQLLRRQLEPYSQDIAQVFAGYEREISTRLAGFDPRTPNAIQELERQPLVGLIVVVSDEGARGQLIYPDLAYARAEDRSLIVDVVTWLRDSNFTQKSQLNNTVQLPASEGNNAARPVNASPPSRKVFSIPGISSLYSSRRSSSPVNTGQIGNGAPVQFNTIAGSTHWTTWYHGRGMILGYWSATPGDTLTMITVPRGRWLADLIAALPDNSQARNDALLQLLDVEGNIISQWGDLSLGRSAPFEAELAAPDPLDGWRLRLTLSPQARAAALHTDSQWLGILGAAAASTTLILLGILITLNLNRQLRQAAQQVSFVNQVSHELRTPLTNIRMYTDLAVQSLEGQASSDHDQELQRLSIVRQESARLGRLIENVLTFARSGQGERPLRLTSVNADNLIDSIVETFRPQLNELGMKVERLRGAQQPLQIDREVFEQILVNLVSNALKYAAGGKLLRIESEVHQQQLTVRVIDQGPGIPKRMHQRIFQPFVRLRNRLEDPAGTGIGLTIARQLAQHHGGTCQVRPGSPSGCCFEFTCHCR